MVMGGMAISMKSGSASALVEMLGSKLPWWMQYRELFQNGLEAVLATGGTGKLLVFPNDDDKVVVVDTGSGMPRDVAVKHLNTTLSSGNSSEAKLGQNHGLGSKITARYRNPHSLEYLTYDGKTVTALSFIKKGDEYVIDSRNADDRDGARSAKKGDLHPEIRAAGHGTQVTLGGKTKGDRTAKMLPNVVNQMSARIWSRNDALDEFTVTTLEGENIEMSGVCDRMLKNAADYGYVQLENAVAHWFTFREADQGGLHAGLVAQDEVYHPADGREAMSWMQRCGIHEGAHLVAVYFEPDPEKIVPNAERDSLFEIGGRRKMTTWIGRWCEMFREQMPSEIIDLVAEETQKAFDGMADFDPEEISRWQKYFRSGVKGRSGTSTRPKRAPGEKALPKSKKAQPLVRWTSASEKGPDFFKDEAGIFEPSGFVIWLNEEFAPHRALLASIEKKIPEERVDIMLTCEAILKSRIAAITVDAFFGAKASARATQDRTVEKVFNDSVSAVCSMRATALMPHIEEELRSRLKVSL